MPRQSHIQTLPHLSEEALLPVIPDDTPGLGSALSAIVAASNSTTLRRLVITGSGFPLADDMPAFLLFNQLIYRGAARPTDIADAIDMSRSNISRIVSRMEEAGLIIRAPDPADDRALIIALTPHGREIAQQAVQVSNSIFSSMVDEWTPEELALLEKLIIKLAQSMDTASDHLLARVAGTPWLQQSESAPAPGVEHPSP